MFLSAFAAAAGSDLLVTAPRRLVERFGKNFGLQSWPLPLASDIFTIDGVRSQYSMSDPAIDWLVENIITLLQ